MSATKAVSRDYAKSSGRTLLVSTESVIQKRNKKQIDLSNERLKQIQEEILQTHNEIK